MACGSGLERIYAFLATDEPSNRPKIDLGVKLARPCPTAARGGCARGQLGSWLLRAGAVL